MSINEEIGHQGNIESFWEVGKYVRTVKRIDNGYKLCDSLRQLIEQRSEIEKSYAKQLSQWSKKWNDFLDKGPEYNTTQDSWRAVLTESDKVSDLHTEVAEKLMTSVYTSIRQWQKENYHKSMMHFKETKEVDDQFKKAQKPWEKKLTKVIATKKDYHTACRQEKSTANQENNARGDSAVAPDQLKKLQERLKKCQQEVESCRERYTAALNDLNGYNARYMEDMTEVFSRCQDMEKNRIDFFKKSLFEIHQCMDLSVEPRFSQIYTDLHSQISRTDPEDDLRWWSHNHGVDMAMNWPIFEEYSPELQKIHRKEKSSQVTTSSDGITITSIKHHSQVPDIPQYGSQTSNSSASSGGGGPPPPPVAHATTNNHQVSSSVPEDIRNPFGDDADWGEDDRGTGEDDRGPGEDVGTMVRALYDYEKAEDDEICFKAGDVFAKLTEEDELGWCRGRKEGTIGLYPANYVEPL